MSITAHVQVRVRRQHLHQGDRITEQVAGIEVNMDRNRSRQDVNKKDTQADDLTTDERETKRQRLASMTTSQDSSLAKEERPSWDHVNGREFFRV